MAIGVYLSIMPSIIDNVPHYNSHLRAQQSLSSILQPLSSVEPRRCCDMKEGARFIHVSWNAVTMDINRTPRSRLVSERQWQLERSTASWY